MTGSNDDFGPLEMPGNGGGENSRGSGGSGDSGGNVDGGNELYLSNLSIHPEEPHQGDEVRVGLDYNIVHLNHGAKVHIFFFIDNVEIKHSDNGNYFSEEGSKLYGFRYNTSGLSVGEHSLRVMVEVCDGDKASNVMEESLRMFNVYEPTFHNNVGSNGNDVDKNEGDSGLSRKVRRLIDHQEKVCPQCGGSKSWHSVEKGVVTIVCPDCGKKRFFNISDLDKVLTGSSKLGFAAHLGKKGYHHVKEKHGKWIWNVFLFLCVLGIIVIGLNIYSNTGFRGADSAGELVDGVSGVASADQNPIAKLFSALGRPFSNLFDSVETSAGDLWVYWTRPDDWDDKGNLDDYVVKTEGESYNAVELYQKETGQINVMPATRPTQYNVAYQNLGTQVPKELYITMSLGERIVENGGYIRPRGVPVDGEYVSFYESYSPTRAVIKVSRMPKYYEGVDTMHEREVFKIRSPVCSGSFPVDINMKYEYETSTDWDPQFLDREIVDEELKQAKYEESRLHVSTAASGPVDIAIYSLIDQIIIEADETGKPSPEELDIVHLNFGLLNYRRGTAFINKVMWRVPEFLEVVEDEGCALVVVEEPDMFMGAKSGYIKYVPKVYDEDGEYKGDKISRVIDGSSSRQRKVFFCSFRYNALKAKAAGLSLPMIVHIDSKLNYDYEFDYSGYLEVDDTIGVRDSGVVRCGSDEAEEAVSAQWKDGLVGGDLSVLADELGLPYGDDVVEFSDKAVLRDLLRNYSAGCVRLWAFNKEEMGYVPNLEYLPCPSLKVKFNKFSCCKDELNKEYFDEKVDVSIDGKLYPLDPKEYVEKSVDSVTDFGRVIFDISNVAKENVIDPDKIYEISFKYYDTFLTKFDSVAIGMDSVQNSPDCNLYNGVECESSLQCISEYCGGTDDPLDTKTMVCQSKPVVVN